MSTFAKASNADEARTVERLLDAARTLRDTVDRLAFAGAVAYVYDPLDYAWAAHEAYVRRFGNATKRVLMLGMNPGPFGMMQTGVPFGEVAAVRDWMGIEAPIAQPIRWHPKRPIQGFSCTRSEVSGRRLWGWAASRFGSARRFFDDHFVVNYCPLVFLEASGRNLTPDKLPAAELAPLQAACDAHLRAVVAELSPEWLLGIGGYAAKRLSSVFGLPVTTPASTAPPPTGACPPMRIAQILHPSPASPLANRGWEEAVDRALEALGVHSPVGADRH